MIEYEYKNDYVVNIIEELAENNALITNLSLRQCSIRPNLAKEIANALKNNTRLKVLDLSENPLTYLAVGLILEAKKETLLSLTCERLTPKENEDKKWLHHEAHFNKLGHLVQYIKNSRLKELNLSHNKFNDDEASAIKDMLNANKTLISLNLSYCDIGCGGIGYLSDALLKTKSLMFLDFSCNRINREEMVCFSTALSKNDSLVSIDLSHCSLGDHIDLIIYIIEHNKSLRSINLKDNYFNNKALKMITKALKQNTNLIVELDSDYDSDEELKIDDEAFKLLLNDKKNSSFKLKNFPIRPAKPSFIANQLAENDNLISIDFGYENFNSKDMVLIFQALENNKTLQSIKIQGNRIEDRHDIKIVRAISKNTSLRSVRLDGDSRIKDEIKTILLRNRAIERIDEILSQIKLDASRATVEESNSEKSYETLNRRLAIIQDGIRVLKLSTDKEIPPFYTIYRAKFNNLIFSVYLKQGDIRSALMQYWQYPKDMEDEAIFSLAAFIYGVETTETLKKKITDDNYSSTSPFNLLAEKNNAVISLLQKIPHVEDGKILLQKILLDQKIAVADMEKCSFSELLNIYLTNKEINRTELQNGMKPLIDYYFSNEQEEIPSQISELIAKIGKNAQQYSNRLFKNHPLPFEAYFKGDKFLADKFLFDTELASFIQQERDEELRVLVTLAKAIGLVQEDGSICMPQETNIIELS